MSNPGEIADIIDAALPSSLFDGWDRKTNFALLVDAKKAWRVRGCLEWLRRQELLKQLAQRMIDTQTTDKPYLLSMAMSEHNLTAEEAEIVIRLFADAPEK